MIAFATVNAGYARYELVLGDMAESRLEAFQMDAVRVDGWRADHLASYTHGRQFFGEASTWDRYTLTASPGASLYASVPVYLDVITTDDYSALAAYGIEACYDFHGFRIASVAATELGSGVTGEVLSYTRRQSGADWTTLYWEWPYREDGATRFARLVMLVPDGPTATIRHDEATTWESPAERFQATEALLVDLASRVVATQLPAIDPVASR